jgi:nucleotide-binding universal stress UspA family protein
MISAKKILFPTDFSTTAEHAFNHAIFLARRNKAELHLLHVVVMHRRDMSDPMHHVSNAEEIYDMLRTNAVERLKDAVDTDLPGVNVHTDAVMADSPADGIINYAVRHSIDLIVIGTHGRYGLDRFLMGSVAERTVRFAPCSVLTIQEQSESDPQKAVNNILVPVDFSDDSRTALRVAVEAASVYASTLHILHVLEHITYPAVYMSGMGLYDDWLPAAREKTKDEILRLMNEYGSGFKKSEIHILDGHAADVIIGFTKENPVDLIIIATHGLRGFQHLLLGSVTERVVRFVRCPVLTIKNPELVQYLQRRKVAAA